MILNRKSLDSQVIYELFSDRSGVVCFHTQLGNHVILPPEYLQFLIALDGSTLSPESPNDLAKLFSDDEIKYAVNTLEVNGFIVNNDSSQAVRT